MVGEVGDACFIGTRKDSSKVQLSVLTNALRRVGTQLFEYSRDVEEGLVETRYVMFYHWIQKDPFKS